MWIMNLVIYLADFLPTDYLWILIIMFWFMKLKARKIWLSQINLLMMLKSKERTDILAKASRFWNSKSFWSMYFALVHP